MGNPGNISASPEEIKCECLRLIQITTNSNPNNNIKYDSNLPHCGFGMILSHHKLADQLRNPSATSAA
ncbi:unnamed protein product [Tenebrio molitor]|jgi:hypothetical protein|nr:unnamed protein product [Tenebrio molitor]